MPRPEQIADQARELWGLELSAADAQRLAEELRRLASQAKTADFDVEPGSDFARRLARAATDATTR
jgi:hypothetical protein